MIRALKFRTSRRTGRVVRPARGERGYALLIVVFLAAVMIIVAGSATLNLLTQGRRERDDEMIWRGEQYERAIRLYYHKNGRFPGKIDDLVKGTLQLRFLRKEYKDPSNSQDGSWRLIYVTPAGGLVGSVRYHSLAEMNAAQHPGQATPFGTALPANPLGQPPTNPLAPMGSQGQPVEQNPSDQSQQGTPPQVPTTPQSAAPQNPQGPGGITPGGLQPQPLTGGSSGAFGGSIIGVGGTADKPSLKVYLKGKKYREWEFIWNPLAEATIQSQPGATLGQPVGAPQGTPPQPTPQQPPQEPPLL
jgi:type II secretory pathway pseudopilin PulG